MNCKILSTAVIMASLTMVNVASADHMVSNSNEGHSAAEIKNFKSSVDYETNSNASSVGSSVNHVANAGSFDYRSAVQDVVQTNYNLAEASYFTTVKSGGVYDALIEAKELDTKFNVDLSGMTSGSVFERFGGKEGTAGISLGDVLTPGVAGISEILFNQADVAKADLVILDDIKIHGKDAVIGSFFDQADVNKSLLVELGAVKDLGYGKKPDILYDEDDIAKAAKVKMGVEFIEGKDAQLATFYTAKDVHEATYIVLGATKRKYNGTDEEYAADVLKVDTPVDAVNTQILVDAAVTALEGVELDENDDDYGFYSQEEVDEREIPFLDAIKTVATLKIDPVYYTQEQVDEAEAKKLGGVKTLAKDRTDIETYNQGDVDDLAGIILGREKTAYVPAVLKVLYSSDDVLKAKAIKAEELKIVYLTFKDDSVAAYQAIQGAEAVAAGIGVHLDKIKTAFVDNDGVGDVAEVKFNAQDVTAAAAAVGVVVGEKDKFGTTYTAKDVTDAAVGFTGGGGYENTNTAEMQSALSKYTEADVIEAEKVKQGLVKIAGVDAQEATHYDQADVDRKELVKLGEVIVYSTYYDQADVDAAKLIKVGDVKIEGSDAVEQELYTQADVEEAEKVVLGGVKTAAVAGVDEVVAGEADVVAATAITVANLDARTVSKTLESLRVTLATLEALTAEDDSAELLNMIASYKSAIQTLEDALDVAAVSGEFEAGSKVARIMTALEGFDSDELESKINPDVGAVTSGAIAGLNAVSGSVVSHQSNLIANSGRYGLSGVSSGLNAGGEQNSNGAWLKVFGSTSDMGMRDDIAGYDADALGMVIGIDKVNNDSMIGFAFSSTDIDVEGKSSNNSKTESNSYQGTVYGTILNDNHYINGSLAYAHSTSDTSRTGIDGTVSGEFDTKIFSAEIGAGIPIKMDSNMVVTPEVKMSYSHVNIGEYTEEGVAALNINPEDMNLMNIKVGTTFSNKMGDLTTNLRLIADWDVTQEKATVNSSFASTGAALPVSYGPEPSALGGIVGVGVDYASADGVYVLNLNYDAGIRPDFISHTGSAKVRMNF